MLLLIMLVIFLTQVMSQQFLKVHPPGDILSKTYYDLGIGFQFHHISGHRIKSVSNTTGAPSYNFRTYDDTYPVFSISAGAYMPVVENIDKRYSLGLLPNVNLAAGVGKLPNTYGYNGTFLYSVNAQAYAGFKYREGAITDIYRKKSSAIGYALGVGAHYSAVWTDYYVPDLKYNYIEPSLYGAIMINTGYRGFTILFKFYKTLKFDLKYQSYTGDIPGLGFSEYGIHLTKVLF